MFNVEEKRDISDKIQKIIRETNHPGLPDREIRFQILIEGINPGDKWTGIRNNSDGKHGKK